MLPTVVRTPALPMKAGAASITVEHPVAHATHQPFVKQPALPAMTVITLMMMAAGMTISLS